jgi:hypothetical protein
MALPIAKRWGLQHDQTISYAAGRSTYRSRSGWHDDVLRALGQGVAWCEHGQLGEVRTVRLIGT